MKLYEIVRGLQWIDAAINEAGGEIDARLAQELAELDYSLEVKADNIAAMIIEAEHAQEALIWEANRFSDRAMVQERKAKRLKEWLKHSLTDAGRTKVKGERFTLVVQTNGQPSIRWESDIEPIPSAFTRVRIEPDGDAIRRAWKAGALPEGFSVRIGTHLRIR
jgi:hypothetical protein